MKRAANMEAVAAKVRDDDEGKDIVPDTMHARSQAGATRTGADQPETPAIPTQAGKKR